jgi:hypothetical protein
MNDSLAVVEVIVLVDNSQQNEDDSPAFRFVALAKDGILVAAVSNFPPVGATGASRVTTTSTQSYQALGGPCWTAYCAAEQHTNVLMGVSGICGNSSGHSGTRMIDLSCGTGCLDEVCSNHRASLVRR